MCHMKNVDLVFERIQITEHFLHFFFLHPFICLFASEGEGLACIWLLSLIESCVSFEQASLVCFDEAYDILTNVMSA